MKIYEENLADLLPDWLYSWYHYTHPPMLERIGAIKAQLAGLSKVESKKKK
jgi:Zn-dependent protease with chaperone function